MRVETHKEKCRRREAEGGTVRYDGGRFKARKVRMADNHERVRPGWFWRGIERIRDKIRKSGKTPPANPYPEPPAERPPLIDRDLLDRQERDAEARRLKPGERRTSKSELWPRYGAKELAR